jgi:hypothetical protein
MPTRVARSDCRGTFGLAAPRISAWAISRTLAKSRRASAISRRDIWATGSSLRGQAVEQRGRLARLAQVQPVEVGQLARGGDVVRLLLQAALELGGAELGRVGGHRRLRCPSSAACIRRRRGGPRGRPQVLAVRRDMSTLRTDLEHLLEAAVDLAEELAQGPVLDRGEARLAVLEVGRDAGLVALLSTSSGTRRAACRSPCSPAPGRSSSPSAACTRRSCPRSTARRHEVVLALGRAGQRARQAGAVAERGEPQAVALGLRPARHLPLRRQADRLQHVAELGRLDLATTSPGCCPPHACVSRSLRVSARLQDAAPPGRAGAGDPQVCCHGRAAVAASATCWRPTWVLSADLLSGIVRSSAPLPSLTISTVAPWSRLGSSSGPENSAVPSR